jgi:hypothetical protein
LVRDRPDETTVRRLLCGRIEDLNTDMRDCSCSRDVREGNQGSRVAFGATVPKNAAKTRKS